MLIVFAGLPGTGKSTIARELARRLGAVYLRIDSIELALGAVNPMNDTGYRVAYAVAEDNLRLGLTVVADSVNPIELTRNAWLEVARRSGVRAIEVEVTCSDAAEHRRRVESRESPTWAEVVAREYQAWQREHVIIDTAVQGVDQAASVIHDVIRRPG